MSNRTEKQNRAQNIVNEFRASGLTQKAWCKANNVSIHNLCYWLRKYKEKPISTDESISWIPFVIDNNAKPDAQIKIRMGRIVIEVVPGFSGEHLAEVCRALLTIC